MPTWNGVDVVIENRVGEGSPLIFPGVSTCVAAVVTTGVTLIGAHFTKDLWLGNLPEDYTELLLVRFLEKIADRNIDHLLFVGHTNNHNPTKLAQRITGQPVPRFESYDISRKGKFNAEKGVKEINVTLMFESIGAGIRPKVSYGVSNKAVVNNVQGAKDAEMRTLLSGVTKKIYHYHDDKGDLTVTGSLHTLRKNFI